MPKPEDKSLYLEQKAGTKPLMNLNGKNILSSAKRKMTPANMLINV